MAVGLTREKCWVFAAPVMPTLSLSAMATRITFPIFSNWIITFPYFSVSLPASLIQVPGLGFSPTHSHPLLSTEDNYSVAQSLSLSWTAESSWASESLRHQLGSSGSLTVERRLAVSPKQGVLLPSRDGWNRSALVVLSSFTPQLHTWGLASSHPPLSPPSSLLEVKFLPPARPPSFLPLSKNSDSDLKGLEDSVGRVLASSMSFQIYC